MVWGPLCGECKEFHGIHIQDKLVAPNVDAQASAPFSNPLCFELVISRMKRAGIEVIVASEYLLSLTGVISTSATRMPKMTFTHPLPLHIKLFTLYLSRKLRKMST